jgi:hypothetical protein
MTAGGYPTWTSLGDNGHCWVWFETTNGKVKEVDVLVNSNLGTN